MIRAAIFDFAGVMTQHMVEAMAPAFMASGHDLEELSSILSDTFLGTGDTNAPAHQLERGEISLETFLDAFPHHRDKLADLLVPGGPFYVMENFHLHKTMATFVGELRASGYRTALLSNNVREWQQAWDRALDGHDLFDELVFSWQVGLRKPSAEVFAVTLERLGVRADEALFFDDSPAMVDGARAAGLAAIHVDDHDEAIAKAKEMLAR